MNAPTIDPVVALVEQTEASAIAQGVLDATDIDTRRRLRVEVLDALTSAKRARRMAMLLDRLVAEANAKEAKK